MMLEDCKNTLLKKARELQGRYRLTQILRTAIFGLVLALILCLGLAICKQFIDVFRREFLLLVLMICGIGVSAGVLMSALKPRDYFSRLTDAERKYGIKEVLSTAYELVMSEYVSIFSDAVLEDAALKASEVRASQVYPMSLPRRTLFIPLILVGIVFFANFNLKSIWSSNDTLTALNEQVMGEGRKIEELGRRLAREAEQKGMTESVRIAQELQRLGRRMQEEELNREETMELISEYTQEIERSLEGLQEKIVAGKTEGSAEIEKMLDQLLNNMNSLQPRSIVPGADQLANQLANPLANPLADDLTESQVASSLERSDSYEDGEFDGYEGADLDPVGTDSVGTDPVGEDPVGTDSVREDTADRDSIKADLDDISALIDVERRLEEALQSLASPQDSAASPQTSAASPQTSAASPQTSAEIESEMTEEGGDVGESENTGLPGAKPVEDEKSDSTEIPSHSDDGMVSELKGEIDDQGMTRTPIRSLPEETLSKISAHDVDVTYMEQLESVISKDAIPGRLRENVKNYFLRIGVSKGQ